ncbi:T9SS type A sorting domain-containing protein [Maribacter flavus]|uniref:DUF11 domain-containing protein n=1 Tax=Maribacter flavus TaxID=1658664 RepID=A0A5B2TPR4_9FLAO|nr:T9SS type A sorting domain-containing protein [Maribacter flavus]KAA2216532.1 DUF11 domain-containing protein [Maribacter flavus]
MRKITLLCTLLFTLCTAFAQTTLGAGDIAFVGLNTDGATDSDDNFAFILLKDIDAATQIIFTDRGWSDATGFSSYAGDGEFTWISGAARTAGEVVVLDFSNLSPPAASFTVLGDQLFAIQGSIASPTFIAGLHFNVVSGVTDDANWDGDATSNTTSALPDALTTGDTAVRLSGPGGIEQDNFQFSCGIAGCPLSGTPEEIRAIVHNLANWVSDNDNVYPGTVDASLGTPTVSECAATLTASVTEVCLSFSPPDTIDLTGSSTPDPTGSGTFSLGVGSDIPATNTLVDNGNGTGTFNPIAAGAGTYILVYTHTNSTGCVAEAQETIVVYPEADISITGPSSVAEDGAPVNFQGLLGGAATSGVVAMIPSPPSGSFSGSAVTAIATYTPAIGDAGDYNIQFTYVDSDNNSCINILRIPFTVEPVGDTTPPEITCPPDQILIADSNCNVLVPDYTGLVTATDNVTASPIITQSPPAGSTFNGAGTTVIVFTATDDAGNSVTCNMGLTIEDNKAPTPICINGLTVELDATTGLGTIFASDFIASPTVDACGPVTYLISRVGSDVKSTSLTLSCEDEENTLVRIWAEDVNGNSDYCETYIQVDRSKYMCPVTPIIDLELEKSIDNLNPNIGDVINFTVTITNNGPGIATGVEVIDKIPSGYTATGAGSVTNGTYDFGPGRWHSFAPILPGDSETLVLEVTVNASGEYLNLAEITAANETDVDSSPANGVDTDGDGNVVDDPDDEDDGDGAKVNVIIPCEVSINIQPQDVTVCEIQPFKFEVEASGTGTLSYQWEFSPNEGLQWFPQVETPIFIVPQGAVENADGWIYRVIVTSDNGTPDNENDDCSVTSDVVTLTVNPLPEVEITGRDSYCHDGNGVELDAGAGFSSYLWSPGGQTTRTITALEGSYTVTVTNEFGCESTSEAFIVTNNEPLTCSIEQDILTTDHLTEDGVATVTPIGGKAPFTYLWDNGETTQTATSLTYGLNSVTVTDANGCATMCQIDIAKELYCWVNLIQNVSEYGGQDGAARVSGNGGYRPFTFKWDDGSTEQTNNSLTAGIHTVTITDAKGATSQCSITIMEPTGSVCDKFTSDVEQVKLTTDHLTEDGVATVTPYGGTAPYTYYWDNGETTQTATTLTYGMHSVTVTDANGCESMSYIDIAKELYCWINLYGNVSVKGGNDGSAMVHGNGGYRPFTFQWDDGTTSQLNTNLKAGTHYVTITDATGSTSRCSITVTEPNEEICDGVDNDGDGKVDEGFDADGDGIADCYDKCPNGDDSVDKDGDGIPDACDDVVCIKPEMPQTACYETAIWNPDNCRWDIVGEQPEMPVTECYETAVWNAQTCSWDIVDGQPETPVTECYETAVWNAQTCSWDIVGEQPEMPVTECYETAVWNAQTCSWDIVDGQPEMPVTECYETAVWNAQTCSWDIVGEQPEMPVTECYETAEWNAQTCSWDIVGEQPEMPETECYDTATWNPDTCSWDVEGEQPLEPEIECYQTATWNPDTCEWEIEGEQPEMPETLCYETAIWNSDTCEWDILQDGDPSCAGGSIDKCETAFARSSGSSTCFEDIPNFNSPRWGWTNEFPSINGAYEMELYAAAGQCDISKGALVGSVEVVYSNGSVEVTVSVLNGYKMTEAQLHVGTDPIPTNPNNGNLTVAPGQYAHKYEPGSDFTNYTFKDIGTGDADIFYVILHAEVCPMDDVSKYQAPTLELSGYPVPFKEDFTLVVISPSEMKSELSLYDGIGKRVQTFGNYYLKKGRNEIGLRTNELPAGMYYVYVTTGSGKQILKVLRRP